MPGGGLKVGCRAKDLPEELPDEAVDEAVEMVEAV